MRPTCLLSAATAFLFATSSLSANPPTEIDLLIVHTPSVTTNYGGNSGVEAHALASVTTVNDALEDSDIPVVFNLVAVEEIAYTESATSIADDLEAIAGKSDPVDPTHSAVLNLRDIYGADLVTLFRDGPVGGNAGLAYILDPQNDSVDSGYAVVSDASASNQLTLAHELGHNMASAHARADPGNPPPIDEARGYTFTANGTDYRTIMGIDSDFSRIAQYSNPAVLFEGVATGLPAGDPEAADNASAFAVSTPVIAGFRRTQTENPSFLEEPVGATLVAGANSRLRALLRGLPPLTVEWFEGEVGDEAQPITSSESELERGGTESIIDLTGVTETTKYWLRVTNDNDTLESSTFRVVLVPAPSGGGALVEQAVRDSGFELSFGFEQEMTVPAAAYLETIRLILAKEGNPPNPTVRFEEIGGEVIFEQELDASLIDAWPTQSVQDFSVGRFVAPGTQLRLTLTPNDGQDESNLVIWHFADEASVTDPNVGDSNLIGDQRLMFSLLGTQAWTYHTWLDDAQIPAETNGLQPSDQSNGLENLIRYALGGDFDTPANEIGPQVQPLENTPGGPEAKLRYTRRPGIADVTFVVEQSDDLENWTAVDPSGIEELPPTPEGNEAFEARIPYDGDRLFLRLNTENPPSP